MNVTDRVARSAVQQTMEGAHGEAPWRRIDRRDERGVVTDWVEVGQCARCGRGVDRALPVEYRAAGGEVVCRSCARR